MRRNLFVALAAGALFAADPSGARAQNTPEQYAEQWTEARRGEGDWTQRATGQRTMVAGMLFDAGGGTAGGGGPAELLGQTQQSSATPPNPATAELLAAHNWERAQVGAPPLKWDPQLAANAAAYAAYLARIGRLVHAPREGRGIERENLSQGMIGWSPLQMLRNGTNEKRNFVPGISPTSAAPAGGGTCRITRR